MRTPRTPSYRLHRPTGLAVITLNGRDHYLGRHNSPESRAEYDRLLAEWLANGRQAPVPPGPDPSALTVVELIVAHVRHAQDYYKRPDGGTSAEVDNIKDALRPVRRLYGHTPAADFGPLALKAVRRAMIDSGLCRNVVNRRIGRVKRMFKWAVSNEMIAPAVYQALAAVEGLRAGREGVRESAPVRPVPDAHVDAIRPHVALQVWAMVELQRLTGMRPGEVTIMRPCDLDRTGAVWLYRPPAHKTQWKDKSRIVALGPRAQSVLAPWLLRSEPTAYLFRPVDTDAELRRRKREARVTPMTPSQAARKSKRNRRRPPGEVYCTRAYAYAIRRACDKAGVPVWGPNRLRHNAATQIRARYGLEHAKAVLGHDKIETTTVYAEADLAKAVAVAREVG